jgi:hypothetical protein
MYDSLAVQTTQATDIGCDPNVGMARHPIIKGCGHFHEVQLALVYW